MKKIGNKIFTVVISFLLLTGCGANQGSADASIPKVDNAAKTQSPSSSPAGQPTDSVDEAVASAETSTVYMITDITPEGLMAVYKALDWTPTGNAAVKLSTGEPPNSNYLKPELIKDLVQTVTLNYGEHEIKLTIGSTTAYLDGAAQTLDVSPSIINGRTMLPIRFISESFGFQIDWDGSTSTVIITKETFLSAEKQSESKILIAYFTVPESDGVDAVARASRVVVDGEVVGNTQFIAQTIQKTIGGDLFAIQTVEAYPARPELMDRGADEKSQNARPELSTQIENLEDYDVVFIGYPIWNADLPMPLYTFLEKYDFSGKTVVPFSAHGGSGFSNTIRTITGLQPNATVITNGFTVSRDNVPNSTNDIIDWVKNLNLTN